jgi:phosphopantetheinyl transferase
MTPPCLIIGLARYAVDPDTLPEALAGLPGLLRARAPSDRQPLRLAAYIASRQLLLDTLRWLPSEQQPADGADHLLRRQEGGSPFWSVSHTDGLVACAWSTAGPCGVDIESAHRAVDADRVIRRYFSRQEQAWLGALPKAERRMRFLDLWTRKEAVIKALGVGIAGHLAAISFGPDRLPPLTLPAGIDNPVNLQTFRPPEGMLAAAWQGSPEVRLIRSGF